MNPKSQLFLGSLLCLVVATAIILSGCTKKEAENVETNMATPPAEENNATTTAPSTMTTRSAKENNAVTTTPSTETSIVCVTHDFYNKPAVIEVSFHIKNISSKPVELWHNDFVLTDDANNSYTSTSDYPHFNYFESLLSATISPKLAKNYSLVYEVPGKGSYFFHTREGLTIALDPIKNCFATDKEETDLNPTNPIQNTMNAVPSNSKSYGVGNGLDSASSKGD